MKECVHRIVPLVVKRKGSRGFKSVKICYGMLFCVDFCYDITDDCVMRWAHSPEGGAVHLRGGFLHYKRGSCLTSTLGRMVKAARQRFTLPGSSPGALIYQCLMTPPMINALVTM